MHCDQNYFEFAHAINGLPFFVSMVRKLLSHIGGELAILTVGILTSSLTFNIYFTRNHRHQVLLSHSIYFQPYLIKGQQQTLIHMETHEWMMNDKDCLSRKQTQRCINEQKGKIVGGWSSPSEIVHRKAKNNEFLNMQISRRWDFEWLWISDFEYLKDLTIYQDIPKVPSHRFQSFSRPSLPSQHPSLACFLSMNCISHVILSISFFFQYYSPNST